MKTRLKMNFPLSDLMYPLKKKNQTPIKSAFLKTPTVQELLKIGVHNSLLKGIHPESMIRIKVEIDTDPPLTYACDQKFLTQPLPISIKCVNEEYLFACKMRAALYRAWKGRVKGRDWYDALWFVRKKTPLNLTIFSQLLGQKQTLSRTEFLTMAKERIELLDVSAAVQDIIHFVKDKESITNTWSREFFYYWIELITTRPG